MSKKHRNRNFQQQPAPTADAPAEGLIDIDQLGGKEAVEETDELEAAREEAATEEAAVAEEAQPKAEEAVAPAAVEEPKKEEAPAAAPEAAKASMVELPKIGDKKVIVRVVGARNNSMAPKRAPNAKVVSQLQQMSSEDLSKHSIVGRQVIKMFDEYIAIRKTMNPKNPADRNRAARKLYDIVVTCCPRNSSNRNAAYDHELIMICFKRMSQYFGTYFTDKSLLLGDYTLPSPSEAIKFDAFYGALYQLADAAKTGARITFNMKTLGTLLNAPGAAKALQTIKERLESRNV
jgi:hypothetical protein